MADKEKRRSKGDGGIYYSEAHGRWEAVVELPRVGGKRRRPIVTGATRNEVKGKLRQRQREQEQGVTSSERLTVESYLRRWLEVAARPSTTATTHSGYESICRVRIVPLIGHLRLDKLTALDVQEMYETLGKAHTRGKDEVLGLSARSILHTHRCLKEALSQAVGWGLLARNPADGASAPRAESREIHPLTGDEVSRFLASSAGSPEHPLWTVAIATGMRQGELLGLRWQDVDLEEKRLRVVQTIGRVRGQGIVFKRPKTKGSRRVVMLADEAARALREQRRLQNIDRLQVANLWEDHDLVFPRAFGRPQDGAHLTRRLHRALKQAGVADVRFHDLRHTCATLLLGAGTHPKVVSEMLGHANIGITLDTYSHYIPALHTAAAEAMDRLLGGAEHIG